MKEVILCGGYGTRLGEETKLRLKPMVNVGGKPILWLGNKILAFEKDFGGDLDAYWQYSVLESWLIKQEKL